MTSKTSLHTSFIVITLARYGFKPSSEQAEAIREYVSLLLRWNQRISLTRVTDPVEILRFHFGESLFATEIVPIRQGRLADVGSGAGFPGLALKIAVPELEVVLIESSTKKSAFLAEVCRSLGLKGVRILKTRAEDLKADDERFEFVTARALGNYSSLLSWASRHFGPSAKIVLWLGTEEVDRLSGNVDWTWRKPELIPGANRRFILVGSPRRRS